MPLGDNFDFPVDHLVASSRSWDNTNLSRTTYFYTLSVEELIQMVRSRLVLPLTPDQCLQYLHTDTCPAEL